MTVNDYDETIFLQGEKYFESLFNDIAHAKENIDIETYIFENDALGERVIHALKTAAERGVKVRILVDGVGTPDWGGGIQNIKSVGIEARVYHPSLWRLWQWRRAMMQLPFLPRIYFFISQLNKRNHRKVCIIDRKIVYIGSANISQCHLSEKHGGKNWRDIVVRLTNIDISDLEDAFHAAWNHIAIQERLHNIFEKIDTNAVIRLNYSRHRRRVLYKNLLKRIAKCRKRVWITNAYFVPDNFLLKKLEGLAQKGKDVRILLPWKSDVFILPWASAAFYEKLLKSGVRIFQYIPSMLHAKSLILDDWFLVGSSNLNHRSLLHDLEVDVTIQSPENKALLEHQFVKDLSNSREIDLKSWHKRNYFQKLIGRLLLYVKYWM